MKEPSRFLSFLPDFSSFFPIFPDFPPLFGKFSAVRGGTLPPCTPSGYATGSNTVDHLHESVRSWWPVCGGSSLSTAVTYPHSSAFMFVSFAI